MAFSESLPADGPLGYDVSNICRTQSHIANFCEGALHSLFQYLQITIASNR